MISDALTQPRLGGPCSAASASARAAGGGRQAGAGAGFLRCLLPSASPSLHNNHHRDLQSHVASSPTHFTPLRLRPATAVRRPSRFFILPPPTSARRLSVRKPCLTCTLHSTTRLPQLLQLKRGSRCQRDPARFRASLQSLDAFETLCNRLINHVTT